MIAPRPHRRVGPAVATLVVIAAACGNGDPATTAPTPAVAPGAVSSQTARPAATTATTTTATPPPPITAIESGATVTQPAERLDESIVVAWIGGSDIELDGRSLPDVVERTMPDVDGRDVVIDAEAVIAPLPAVAAGGVRRAADRNVDAILVSMPPAWTTWDGHEECPDGMAPHDFYVCVLTPRDVTDVTELLDEVDTLIQTIDDTGIPAFMYTVPHSVDALANPALAPRLADAEAAFARLAPSADRIEYRPTILTRGVAGLEEGTAFFDMVHPTETGIELLAELFVDELVPFLATHASR